jgi:hypothetical protein
MRKLALTLTAATFVLGLTASSASAQTQQLGAASMQTQLNNATPIVTPAACRSFDRYCPAGWTRRCWRFPFPHCGCVPCL